MKSILHALINAAEVVSFGTFWAFQDSANAAKKGCKNPYDLIAEQPQNVIEMISKKLEEVTKDIPRGIEDSRLWVDSL